MAWRLSVNLNLKLVPRRIIALDAAGQAHAFRLRPRPDGRLLPVEETAEAVPDGKPFILALAPAIGFHRQTRILPKTADELSVLAADFFPFEPGTATYAASMEAGTTRYHALPRAEPDRILEDWPEAVAVIIAEPQAAALGLALEARLNRGAVADLLPAPCRLIGLAPLLTFGLALLAFGGIFAAILTWSLEGTAHERALRDTLARMEAEAAPVARQRQAVLRMTAALKRQAVFSRRPGPEGLALLDKVLQRLPPGTAIDRIELRRDALVLRSLGNDQNWLRLNGNPPPEIATEPMGKLTRFTATYGLGSVPPIETKGTKQP